MPTSIKGSFMYRLTRSALKSGNKSVPTFAPTTKMRTRASYMSTNTNVTAETARITDSTTSAASRTATNNEIDRRTITTVIDRRTDISSSSQNKRKPVKCLFLNNSLVLC